MNLLNLVRLSVVIISMVAAKRWVDKTSDTDLRRLREDQFKLLTKASGQGYGMCARLSKEPYFSIDMLVGPTWRIYYTWNLDLQKECFDMVFRNATPQIIKRIYKEMNEYLEVEPNWPAASVLVSMGRVRHEMLLFADQGVAGRFQGVPNIVRDGRLPSLSVPLIKFQLKLMYGGKYLLMADCQLGVTSLSARRRAIPFRTEISSIAENLDFGPGHFACRSDMNQN